MILRFARTWLWSLAVMAAVLSAGIVNAKGAGDVNKDSDAVEDLNGARGKIFRADLKSKTFELLKETVIDPKTNEGRSRHTVQWTDKTRFVRVISQNGFAGIAKPVMAHFRNLDDQNAEAAWEGKAFVVMHVTVAADNDDVSEWKRDRHNIVGKFTPDPDSPRQWGGTLELDGKQVPVSLRGPRAQVVVRTQASAADIGKGFWETRLEGSRREGVFAADVIEIYPLIDPRTVDDPGLPRVLVVGDSISNNYHDAAKAALAGVVNYHRIESNGGPSDRGAACIELWLGDYKQKGLHWDLIQFNHGLHDLKQEYDEASGSFGKHQVPLDEYKVNLEKIIVIMKKTGAKLMWCTTTPVPANRHGKWPEGVFGRRKDEDLVFNKAALEVVSGHSEILVNDINSYIRGSAEFDKWRGQDDVHFWGKPEQDIVGKRVAEEIKKALGRDE